MQKDKNKKKTLTISSSISKKFNPSTYGRNTKKSYVVDNKKSSKPQFRANKNWSARPINTKTSPNNRNLNRKYAEHMCVK